MRYCGHFLIKAEGGAKSYERDYPLTLAWRPFTVVFVQRKGYTYSAESIHVLHLLIGFALECRLLEVAASFSWKTTERIK